MRYSDYLNQVNVRHRTVNYNLLTSKNKSGDKGSLAPSKIELSAKQAFDLLAPYCSSRIMEQVKAVVPLAAYLMIFQILVLRHPIEAALILCLGFYRLILHINHLSFRTVLKTTKIMHRIMLCR